MKYLVERRRDKWESVTADRVRFEGGVAVFTKGSVFEEEFVVAVAAGEWEVVVPSKDQEE